MPSLQECQSNLDYWLLTVFIQHKKEEGLFVSVEKGGGVMELHLSVVIVV